MSQQYQPRIIGDVFSLSTVYDEQVNNSLKRVYTNWPERAISGYTAPLALAGTILKYSMSDGTVSTVGSPPGVSSSRTSVSFGMSSRLFGYTAGGTLPPALADVSIISRFDYSTEVYSEPTNRMPAVLFEPSLIAGGNSVGYIVGGTTRPTTRSNIRRMEFSNEVVKETTALPAIRANIGAIASSQNFYFAGGSNSLLSGSFSNMYRFTFSTDLIITLSNLPTTRQIVRTGSNGSYGYFVGNSSGPGYTSTILRIDYSSDVLSQNSTNAPVNLGSTISYGDLMYGYFSFGDTPVSPIFASSTIRRLDYSSETMSDLTNHSAALPGRTISYTSAF